MQPLASSKGNPLSKQRGDFLIESLIGMLLMGVAGMGTTFLTSQVSVNQQQMNSQDIAISKMR